jgi:hypothetical protein
MKEHNFLYEEELELPPGRWEGNSVSQNQLLVVLKIQPRALHSGTSLGGPILFCCFCGWKGPSIVHNEMGVTLQDGLLVARLTW